MVEISMWSTLNEKAFIDGLGAWFWISTGRRPLNEKERVNLLIRYQSSIPGRKRWGNVNRDEVASYVAKRIETMKAKIAEGASE